MHKFVYARAKNQSAREVLIGRINKELLRNLPFVPERITVETVGDRDLYISAVASTSWGIEYIHRKDNTLCLFDGLAFYNEQAAHARDISSAMTFGADHAVDNLQGQYCALRSTPANIIAVTDCTGSRPIYYIESRNYIAVSNRQSLLSPIFTDSGYRSIDLDAAAWTLSHLHLFGLNSIYGGVRLLRPGSALIADASAVHIVDLKNRIWRKAEDKAPPTEADFDTATGDLLSSYRGIANFAPHMGGGSIHLSITGGKDSRLGLALADAAGLVDKVKLFTYGQPQSPECQVSRHLCDLLGLKHHAVHGGDPRSDLATDLIWKRLKFAAFRYDFSNGGVDGGYMPSTQKALDMDLTGSYADIFRRIWQHTRNIKYETVEEAAQHWTYGWPTTFDSLGIMRGDVKAKQREEMKAWIQQKVDAGFDLNDTQEMYYVENRMTWWAGAINTAALSRYRVMPLASRLSSRIGMMLSVEDRQRERLHFEVLKRLSSKLLAAPFLNDTWHADIRRENPGLADAPFALKEVPKAEYAPPWFEWFIKNDMRRIRSYLLDSPHSGLLDIVDPAKLETALLRPDASHPVQARQILNMILMQMALTRDQAQPRDDVRAGSQTEIKTNIPNLSLVEPSVDGPVKPPKSGSMLLTARIPAGTKAIRIDPSSRPGLVRLRNLCARINGGTETIPLDSGSPNGDAVILKSTPSEIIINSVGHDPHIKIPFESVSAVTVEAEIFVEDGGYFEIFWDRGEGFSADNRVRLPL